MGPIGPSWCARPTACCSCLSPSFYTSSTGGCVMPPTQLTWQVHFTNGDTPFCSGCWRSFTVLDDACPQVDHGSEPGGGGRVHPDADARATDVSEGGLRGAGGGHGVGESGATEGSGGGPGGLCGADGGAFESDGPTSGQHKSLLFHVGQVFVHSVVGSELGPYDGHDDAVLNGNDRWLFTEELLQDCILHLRDGMNFGKYLRCKLVLWANHSDGLVQHAELASLLEKHIGFDGLNRNTYFLRVFMNAVFDFIELQRRGGLDYKNGFTCHCAPVDQSSGVFPCPSAHAAGDLQDRDSETGGGGHRCSGVESGATGGSGGERRGGVGGGDSGATDGSGGGPGGRQGGHDGAVPGGSDPPRGAHDDSGGGSSAPAERLPVLICIYDNNCNLLQWMVNRSPHLAREWALLIDRWAI